MITANEIIEMTIKASDVVLSLAGENFNELGNFTAVSDGGIIAGVVSWSDDAEMFDTLSQMSRFFISKNVNAYVTVMPVVHQITNEEAVMFSAADRDGNKVRKIRTVTRNDDGVTLGPVQDEKPDVMCELLSYKGWSEETKEMTRKFIDAQASELVKNELYGGQNPTLH